MSSELRNCRCVPDCVCKPVAVRSEIIKKLEGARQTFPDHSLHYNNGYDDGLDWAIRIVSESGWTEQKVSAAIERVVSHIVTRADLFPKGLSTESICRVSCDLLLNELGFAPPVTKE